MFTLTADFGTIELASGLDDASTRSALANGFCGNLAAAILSISPSRDVYFLAYDIGSEIELFARDLEGPEDFLKVTTHVAVTAACGGFLDSYGVHSRADIESFYGGTLVRGTRSMIQRNYITPGFECDNAAYIALAKEALGLEVDCENYSRLEF